MCKSRGGINPKDLQLLNWEKVVLQIIDLWGLNTKHATLTRVFFVKIVTMYHPLFYLNNNLRNMVLIILFLIHLKNPPAVTIRAQNVLKSTTFKIVTSQFKI